MSGTNNDDIMCGIESKYLSDLLIEILDIVSIALLAKASKVVQILTDLRGGHIHAAAQIIR